MTAASTRGFRSSYARPAATSRWRDGLRLKRRFYLGPVAYDLDRLARCCGPEHCIRYPNPPHEWTACIDGMGRAIRGGWQPPPLIAGGYDAVLTDGNHRHAALLVAGRVTHPTVFFFDHADDRAAFVELSAAHRLRASARYAAPDAAVEVEHPLTGGHVTAGLVRAGGTVRRPAKASSLYVANLLDELHRSGFTGAPRHQGFDDRGREVLDFIAGHVPARGERVSDEQAHAVGALLRELHRVTAASSLAAGHAVVCHGDVKPRNTVFAGPGGPPVAFIDYDNARPGDPLDDVAYAAWLFALDDDVAPPVERARGVAALADGYGLTARQRRRFPDAILARQGVVATDALARAPQTDAAARAVARWAHAAQRFAHTHRGELALALA